MTSPLQMPTASRRLLPPPLLVVPLGSPRTAALETTATPSRLPMPHPPRHRQPPAPLVPPLLLLPIWAVRSLITVRTRCRRCPSQANSSATQACSTALVALVVEPRSKPTRGW